MTSRLHLVDTHCHLHMPEFEGVLEEVLQTAASFGVDRIIIPGVDLESSRKAVELAQAWPNLYAAVGVDPHDAKSWDSSTAAALSELASASEVVAIGEIGLDYYRNHSAPETQRAVFHEQMALAHDHGKPVILHNREATADLLAELERWASSSDNRSGAGVLHAFSASLDAAREAISLGYLIGIGGVVTFKNAAGLRETIQEIGLEHLVLETDAPYLAPHPHRGERNQPGWVFHVAEVLAEHFHTTIEYTAEITTRNANDLFDLNHG